MPRPSQCPVCGCFEFCLQPGTQGCAETPPEAPERDSYKQHGISGVTW